MALSKPIILEIGDKTYAVNEFGVDTMFLLEGDREALVIDTGMGMCDFRAIVESITHLPYTVALTHGHQDHCGSMDQFDRVWLHPADWEAALAVKNQYARRCDSARRLKGLEGDGDVWEYDPDTVCRPWTRTPELLPLADGQVFDLGGRTVETVYTPGHSPGSCCFIDRQTRILFSGDACNVSLMCTDCSIETALGGLRHLQEKQSLFDRNFNGHLAYSSGMNHVAMPRTILEDCITAMERILAGTAEPKTSVYSRWRGGYVNAYLWGSVKLTYDPDKIREGR